MVIDLEARKKLSENRRHSELLSAILKPKEEIKSSSEEGITLHGEFKMDQKVLDYFDKKDQSDKLSVEFFNKLGRTLVAVYNAVKGIRINFPKSYFVHGRVNVDEVKSLPSIEIKNFRDLKEYFSLIENKIGQLATAISVVSSQPSKKEKIQELKVDFSKVEDILEKIDDGINHLSKKEVSLPRTIEVSNFPPTFVPTPVTNININPLRGFVHTTAATVTTNLTTLPTYGVLDNRRSIIVFNNSIQTIYIGGSDVTISNGLPVPKNTYSPPLDAGPRMILYGMVSAGSSDVRVMEISNDAIGG